MQSRIQILRDGHQVSRVSDYILYSVEAEVIGKVVEAYGRCMTPQEHLVECSFSY